MAAPLAGDPILATDGTRAYYVKKSAVQSVTSSTVKVADADFVVALGVGNWEVRTILVSNGSDAGDLSINWTFSGTAGAVARIGIGPGTSSTTYDNHETLISSAKVIGSSINYGTDASGPVAVQENLLMEVTVAGTLTMMWAQGTSDATATTLTGSSRMMITSLDTYA